ncbi:MAG: hypothetical protein LIP06_02905 [Tannerellaceae bacterium]|nr:hypothetical protein [Tannerellaceae bacterium]
MRKKELTMYLKDVFTDQELAIERVLLPKGENFSFEPSFCELWMVKKGSLSAWIGREQKRIIELGQVFFLPPGVLCILISEQNTQCVKFSVPDCVALCEVFFLRD